MDVSWPVQFAFRLVAGVALACAAVACASITGLDAYTKGDCAGDCDAGEKADVADSWSDAADGGLDAVAPDAVTPDAVAPDAVAPDAVAPDAVTPDAVAPDVTVSGEIFDAADEKGDSPDARESSVECDADSCSPPEYACERGGCNAPGGLCNASGQRCSCTTNAQCPSGLCVAALGQNDLSCGARCTGSGVADGFGCLLASPGIPTVSNSAFAYTPRNFVAANYTPPTSATIIDCDTTYDSTDHTFSGFCPGRTPPTITANVPQTGGPAIDILAFGGLTIATGVTLTIDSGGNAVLFAVYGETQIHGTIHADGNDGVSGTTTPGASGAGGDFNCGGSAGTSQPADGACSAGGGGAASASGGAGAGGVGGSPAPGGAARPDTEISPLYGGCPGGTSGSWACRTSGGGGGGALQISTSGLLWFDSVITANGGSGGTSTCFAQGCGLLGYGGGGGGGGSGGAVLLEAQSVQTIGAAVYVNGGSGGKPDTAGGGGTATGGAGGAGGMLLSTTGAPGTGSSALRCGPYSACGGGGGGSYGYFTVRPIDASPCSTSLSPAPALNASKTACQCVSDSNCASGLCVDEGQCTGSCTGAGAADIANCQILTSFACSGNAGDACGF
jgi:hypothetical protein